MPNKWPANEKEKEKEKKHHIPAAQKERFRGVRIFDISDIKEPKQVAAVQTCRGSHTHSVYVDPNGTPLRKVTPFIGELPPGPPGKL